MRWVLGDFIESKQIDSWRRSNNQLPQSLMLTLSTRSSQAIEVSFSAPIPVVVLRGLVEPYQNSACRAITCFHQPEYNDQNKKILNDGLNEIYNSSLVALDLEALTDFKSPSPESLTAAMVASFSSESF